MSKQKPDEAEIKEKMLGQAPTGSTGKVFSPDPDRLLSELEDPNSFIHAFCQNCSSHSELSKDNIRETSRELEFTQEINPDELDPNTQYIHKDSCINCRNEFSVFEVRIIPGTN